MHRTVVVLPDASALVRSTASRLLLALIDAQSHHAPIHVSLTGGTLGIETLAAVADDPLRDLVDWASVHLWWSDERFLPAGDPDRNETQARQALLDTLVTLPAQNVHAIPGPDDQIDSPQTAARQYADELSRWAPDGWLVPAFDVLMLGMGPDGHIASLFPHHPALTDEGVTVGVHNSPKPPPLRVSFTFDTIRSARQVWVITSGADRAAAVASALGSPSVDTTPATGAHGTERTLWLIDAAAAQVAAESL